MKKPLLVLIMLLLSCNIAFSQNNGAFVAELEELALAGDVEAQRNLGYLYWLGNEVEQNDAKAFAFMLQAAENGDVTAQKALAGFYHLGTGVPRDFAQAFAWMEKAALAGEVEAQVNLAQYYYEGRGVNRNVEKAVEWLQKAAAKGSAAAVNALNNITAQADGANVKLQNERLMTPTPESETLYKAALAHFNGAGTAQNLPKAFDLAHLAAAQGSTDACVLLGNMYMDGKVVTRNYKKALEWYLRAAENNNVQGQYLAGIMYYDGKGAKKDNVEALKWGLIALYNLPGNEAVGRLITTANQNMTPAAAGRAKILADKWLKDYNNKLISQNSAPAIPADNN